LFEDKSVTALCYDDILLVPGPSKIESRSQINLDSVLGNPRNPEGFLYMYNPICIAPMEFISSIDMLFEIHQLGGVGFIHRFQPLSKRLSDYDELKKRINPVRIGISIGSEDIDKDVIDAIIQSGCRIILLDIPFSHMDNAILWVKKLRSLVPNNIHIMTGNSSSKESYLELMEAGADSVRIGIGGGAACTTRIETGFGVPVLGSVMDIYAEVEDDEVNGIVADGGIKNNGDIVKALAAGARMVMMGSMFAGYNESGDTFRGLASEDMQIEKFEIEDLAKMNIEGVSGKVVNKGPARVGIYRMINNIKSGVSYVGAENLEQFRDRVKFIRVSQASILESKSRI
jgi:IMP dehydrogenase/GMP reductase